MDQNFGVDEKYIRIILRFLNEQGYSIRLAQHADLPWLADIEQDAASLFPAGSIPKALRNDAVPLPILEHAVEQGGLWVAEQDAHGLVAFALLECHTELALLAEIDVVPKHGRKGLGRALIAILAQKAARLGYKALYLTTFRFVAWNAPFYKQLGFQILSESQVPLPLLSILDAEKKRGMTERVAMRLSLTETFAKKA